MKEARAGMLTERQNLLLTAVHDRAAVQAPMRPDVATGAERSVLLTGQEQGLKPGNMLMADEQGVISSVIYGPDRRTRVTPETREAVFAVYAPPGIGEEAVPPHL